MANHASAIKRMRQNTKQALLNKQHRSRMRTLVKKVETEISEKNIEGAKTDLPAALRILDKSVTKGIIHKNNAARKKSALTRKVNKLLVSQA